MDCAVFRKDPFELIMDIEIIKSSPVGNEKRKALQTECGCAVVELLSGREIKNKISRETQFKFIQYISRIFNMNFIENDLVEYGFIIYRDISETNKIWRRQLFLEDFANHVSFNEFSELFVYLQGTVNMGFGRHGKRLLLYIYPNSDKLISEIT